MSVGRATAKILLEFKRIYGYSPEKIHYIGFSMVAQVSSSVIVRFSHFCAFAHEIIDFKTCSSGRWSCWKALLRIIGEKLGRMTILDAAAPGFEKYGVHVKKEDSEFTVAVHTSAGQSIVTGRVVMSMPLNRRNGSSQCVLKKLVTRHTRKVKSLFSDRSEWSLRLVTSISILTEGPTSQDADSSVSSTSSSEIPLVFVQRSGEFLGRSVPHDLFPTLQASNATMSVRITTSAKLS